MKDYWLQPVLQQESEEEQYQRIAAKARRWEERYEPFEFHLTRWAYMLALVMIPGSKRPAPEGWRAHGISHHYLAFGVPFGQPRDSGIACLSIMTHSGGPMSARLAKHYHPELLARLDEYSPEELRELAQLALEHYNDPAYTFPPSLFAGRPPIAWRIPQRLLPPGDREPVQVVTMSAEPTTMERYDVICEQMRRLGSYSVLVDLREAPDNHRELERRQGLMRNTFTWPRERVAQLLHPIGLRETFGGMKYRQVPGIMHFAQVPPRYKGEPEDPDTALPGKVQVWMPQPQFCAAIVELLMQRRPLLLVDEQPVYEISLRRAVVIHLLSLYSTQIEALPEPYALPSRS